MFIYFPKTFASICLDRSVIPDANICQARWYGPDAFDFGRKPEKLKSWE